MQTRRRILRALRRFHLWIGLLSALYFMMIAATGVALNHRQSWGLEGKYVSRTWLPDSYRALDGAEVRADIAIADLHSGLLFGKAGSKILDVVAVVWFLSIVSGLGMIAVGRSLHGGKELPLVRELERAPVAIDSKRLPRPRSHAARK